MIWVLIISQSSYNISYRKIIICEKTPKFWDPRSWIQTLIWYLFSWFLIEIKDPCASIGIKFKYVNFIGSPWYLLRVLGYVQHKMSVYNMNMHFFLILAEYSSDINFKNLIQYVEHITKLFPRVVWTGPRKTKTNAEKILGQPVVNSGGVKCGL